MKDSNERLLKVKVGILFLTGTLLAIIFAWFLGAFSSFLGGFPINLRFNYVGGLQNGSPVKLAGVTVGKIEKIEFLQKPENFNGDEVNLAVKIRVKKKVSGTIKQDSRFYINMSGIIGDRYLEITPGSSESPPVKRDEIVRGVDPPRIDQLLSQGYGVFGKLMDFIDNNEKTLVSVANNLSQFLGNLNKQLGKSDQADLAKLIENLTIITTNLRPLVVALNTREGRAAFTRLSKIIERADKVDGKAIRKFFQQEGIKTKLF